MRIFTYTQDYFCNSHLNVYECVKVRVFVYEDEVHNCIHHFIPWENIWLLICQFNGQTYACWNVILYLSYFKWYRKIFYWEDKSKYQIRYSRRNNTSRNHFHLFNTFRFRGIFLFMEKTKSVRLSFILIFS